VDRWPEWIADDGNGHIRVIRARDYRMALALATPEGHDRIRDTKGERDEAERHNGRHTGWDMYFVVDDRGIVDDWFAIARRDDTTDNREGVTT